MGEKKLTMADWKGKLRNADYIRRDPEVDDLVENVQATQVVNGGGDIDLDDRTPVLIGLAVDLSSGDKPKSAIAVVQHPFETINSVVSQADAYLRSWYLEDNIEAVKAAVRSGVDFDSNWQAMAWELTPEAAEAALDRLDGEISVTIEEGEEIP